MEKTPSCPRCHSPHVVPILYGLPDSRGLAMLQRGEAALGGCSFSPDSPTRQCKDCHSFIHVDGERYE